MRMRDLRYPVLSLLIALLLVLSVVFAANATAKPTPNMPVGGGNGCVSPTDSHWYYQPNTYFPYSTPYYVAWAYGIQGWYRIGGWWAPYELYCEYVPPSGQLAWVALW